MAAPAGSVDSAATLASPFDELGPSPLARRAANILQAEFRAGFIAEGLPASVLDAAEGGKMFGVLAVETPGGRLGFLRAFSGTLDGRFDVPGYVAPIFDREARESFEPAGERIVKRLTARARAFAASPQIAQARGAAAALAIRQREELVELRRQHAANRRWRRERRVEIARRRVDSPQSCAQGARPSVEIVGPRVEIAQRLAAGEEAPDQALHDLAQQSRRDKAERRRLEETHARQRRLLEAEQARLERRLAAHARLHRMVSRRLMRQIHDTYRVTNARGEVRALRDLYAPAEPPGGAGDCAAPKLLAYAYARGLRPLALAEFWWGAPPAGGGRVSGAFYPACRDKCGPLLAFMLEGLEVAPPRRFGAPDASALELRIVFEDEWIVIVDKPCALLSVPSRSGVPRDSVLARLRASYAGGDGPFLVHRLDLDTSGLLVAARDARTHAALQRQFLTRTVEKRYVAIVEGHLSARRGVIDLPMRVDVNDRPRQIHDPEHGRRALTEWRVLGREALHVDVGVDGGAARGTAGRVAGGAAPGAADGVRGGAAPGTAGGNGPRVAPHTRVAFFPLTGRTHQLRVHAAHPLGLGAPIVGDRLYGHEGPRLMLHAEVLTLTHPVTGERLVFESPAPF